MKIVRKGWHVVEACVFVQALCSLRVFWLWTSSYSLKLDCHLQHRAEQAVWGDSLEPWYSSKWLMMASAAQHWEEVDPVVYFSEFCRDRNHWIFTWWLQYWRQIKTTALLWLWSPSWVFWCLHKWEEEASLVFACSGFCPTGFPSPSAGRPHLRWKVCLVPFSISPLNAIRLHIFTPWLETCTHLGMSIHNVALQIDISL